MKRMTKRVCFNCRQYYDSVDGHFCPNGRFIPGVPNTDTTVQTAAEDLRILKQGQNFGRRGRIIDAALVGVEFCNENPALSDENAFINPANYGDEQSTSSQDYARKRESNLLMVLNSEQNRVQERAVGDMNNPSLFHRSMLNAEDCNMDMRKDFPTTQSPLNTPRLSSMQYQIGSHRNYGRTYSIPKLSYNSPQVSPIRSNSELVPHNYINKSPEYKIGLNDMHLRRNTEKPKTGISCNKKPDSVEDCPVSDPRASPGSCSQLNEQNSPVSLEENPPIALTEQHSVVDIDEKMFICHVCNKGFKQNAHLKEHRFIYDGIKPYECCICQKSFTQKSTLRWHILTHTGERPFSCTFCEKPFTKKCNLNAHLRIHNNEKPFVCQTCGKLFIRKHHLQEHALTHTDKKLFSCEVCGKRYKYKRSLNCHMKTHEPY